MRDILVDVFENQPLDPMETARRGVRPQLRRRFYKDVDVADSTEGFALKLDGRPVRTPARRVLAAPVRELAEALAAEWRAQHEQVDPTTMPLTRLVNTILDGVADTPSSVADDVAKFFCCDLIFYRADGPPGLVARQSQAWDPVVAWAREQLGACFLVGQGIAYVAQPEAALAAARAALPDTSGQQPHVRDIWRIGALHSITTLIGSAVIALAVLRGRLSIAEAWSAAHVDEDWNMETWGNDTLALERRAFRLAEMQAAARVLDALRGDHQLNPTS
jgi:chaperone required for assembly of F1-ATPase